MRRRSTLIVVVVLAAMVGALAGSAGLGPGEAQAAPHFDGIIFNQDRTLTPRRSVSTRIFCPGGRFIPFTWGFRPISPPQRGVSVNAILTAVVPVANGNRVFAFDITLFNPNPGATVRMRVSTTCVKGSGGVRTGIASGPGAAAAKAGKPKLEAASEDKKINVPGGQRVSKKVFCEEKANTVVAEIGFKASRSELVGADFAEKKGRPGAQITLQNRTTADDEGRVYAICIEGERFKVRDKEVVVSRQQRAESRATVSGAQGAAAKGKLLFERTRFSGAIPPGEYGSLLVRCGDPQPEPRVAALPAGFAFRIGGPSGPALEQYLTWREAFFSRQAASATSGAEPSGNGATLVTRQYVEVLNDTNQPAQTMKKPTCVKDTTFVDSGSEVVQAASLGP